MRPRFAPLLARRLPRLVEPVAPERRLAHKRLVSLGHLRLELFYTNVGIRKAALGLGLRQLSTGRGGTAAQDNGTEDWHEQRRQNEPIKEIQV